MVRSIYSRSLQPHKIGLCSDASNGIYFALPIAHKASRGSIVDYSSDNLNRQPLAKVTAKADRLSLLHRFGRRQKGAILRGTKKRAQVIHYQVVDID